MRYRSLTRETAPAVEPVTLTAAKAHLRVDISDDDDLITAIIKAAREWCEEYLDRTLIHTQWTMRMDAFPWEFKLPRPPMAQAGTTTVTSVTYTLETQATATLNTQRFPRGDRQARQAQSKGQPQRSAARGPLAAPRQSLHQRVAIDVHFSTPRARPRHSAMGKRSSFRSNLPSAAALTSTPSTFARLSA